MLVNRNPLVLVGRSTLEPNTLTDLFALMKKQQLKAAVPGYGTTGHLATALFAQEAGVKLAQIPYRGAAPAVTDLLGGQIDLFFATPQSVVQQVATGAEGLRADRKRKAAGISQRRKPSRNVRAETRRGLLAGDVRAGGTPETVIKTLNEALQKAVSDPANVKTWAAQDVSVFPADQRSPAAAARSWTARSRAGAR